MADTMSVKALRQLNSLLLGGYCTHFNRTYWLKAVQDSFNQVPVPLCALAHLQLLHRLVTQTHLNRRVTHVPSKVQVTLSNDQIMLDQDVVAYATGALPLPPQCPL